MADITEIAVAAWRLEKWLDNVNVERKMAAKSSLRAIKKYLQENEIEVVDLTGSRFDVGLAVSVVNNESEETDEEKLLISEMVKPIIKEKGAVIQYGQVILGDEVKQPKANNVVDEAKVEAVEKAAEKAAEEISSDTSDNSTVVADTSQEKIEERVDSKSAKDKKIFKVIAWASVVCLQIIVICLLFRTMGDINILKDKEPVTIVQNEEDKSTEAMTQKEVDLSGVEEGIVNLDTRLNTMESEIGNLNTSLDSISEQIAEIEVGNSGEKTTESTNESEYVSYIVQAGDSLMAICKAKGIDYYSNINEILEINDIADPNQIHVGQLIRLPRH